MQPNNSGRQIPDDHPKVYEKPEGFLLGINPFRKVFHKYEHPVNNNEFGIWRSPITMQEYESAREETIEYFLEVNQPIICQSVQESLRHAIDNATDELMRVRKDMETKLTSKSNLQQQEQSHIQSQLQKIDDQLSRIHLLNESVSCTNTNLKALDQQVEMSLNNLSIDSTLIQNQQKVSVADSKDQSFIQYTMGVNLPEEVQAGPKSIDSEVLKYYNCIHTSFYKVLLMNTVTRCRSELAEFRVCHTRLLKLPNIKERRWNKYLKCINDQHYQFYRRRTGQLYFWEKGGWWKRIIRLGKKIDPE